jgi:hypothetical protein
MVFSYQTNRTLNSAYSELSFWGQLKASPVLLPGLAVSAIIDTAIDRVKDVGIVERSLDIPILQPPHTSTHSLRKMWYPSRFLWRLFVLRC